MSRIRLQRFLTLSLFLIGFAAPAAWAQSSQGGLRGVVKDAQGVIPGVTVTLTNDATGISRETVTNESGE